MIVKGMNIRQMMIMIMVIIMILIVISSHSDGDGDHSNIARISLIDDIDGGEIYIYDWYEMEYMNNLVSLAQHSVKSVLEIVVTDGTDFEILYK